MALVTSVENPDALRSSFTCSDAVRTRRSRTLWSVTFRRTPRRNRCSPENIPATSEGVNPSIAPRSNGWNGSPRCAWTIRGKSIV